MDYNETGADQEIHAEGPDTELARASLAAKPKAAMRTETESEGTLTIDVYQTPTDIVIESAVAGVRPDDIDISTRSATGAGSPAR